MSTAAGWFPDPEDANQLRYWDGQAWTDQRAPAVQTPPPAYQAPPAYPNQPQQYGMPPQYGGPGAENPSNTLSIIGIVCGVVAILFCPIGFGIGGLVLGFVAKSKNERLAPWAIGVSAAGLVLGLVLTFVILSNGGFGGV